MRIWYKKSITIDDLKKLGEGTMADHLGIEWCEIGDNYLKAKMPVDHRTIQPYGLLHGGASCVLAETVGSAGSSLVIDESKQFCAGIEINANHVRGIRQGYVFGTCTPLHLGSSTHVWDIRITDESDKLISVGRLTVAILNKKN